MVDATTVEQGYLTHLATIVVLVLTLLLIARLISERRQPGNTFAWLLFIAFIPYIGIPFYLLFGGRKLRRLAARKGQIRTLLPFNLVPHGLGSSPVVRTLEGNGAPPPLAGNRVQVLGTGEQAFAALEREILGAVKNINLMTFILSRDVVGREIVGLLARRASEGVRVRLLLDAMGSFRSSRGLVRPLREAGGEVAVFMPVFPLQSHWSANLRNHRKIAVFDNTRAIVGGHNLGRDYLGRQPRRKRWRDFGAVVEGPAVNILQQVFLNDWAHASGQALDALNMACPPDFDTVRGSGAVQVVASGPDVEGDPLYEGIVSLIQESKKSVRIVTPYFVPDEVLLRSLLIKARAGHDVTVIVPRRSNHPLADIARRNMLRELRAAGAFVQHFQGPMLHAKLLVVDDEVAVFGSANLDQRSLFVNFEVGVFLYTAGDVRAINTWIDETLEYCTPSVASAMRPPSFGMRVIEDLGRLLAPLL